MLDEYETDELVLEQELINNYWQMPLPKSCRPKTLECFGFNETIAENNAQMLSEMTQQEIEDLDEALDQAMQERGELCSIIEVIRGHRKPKKLLKTKDFKPIVCVRLATRDKGKPKPITIRALLDSGGSGTLVTKDCVTKLSRLKSHVDILVLA